MCNGVNYPFVLYQLPLMSKNFYASGGMDISKCIEGGSMKFTTLVDYICLCAFPCNECNSF